jgi:hypothetical protein
MDEDCQYHSEPVSKSSELLDFLILAHFASGPTAMALSALPLDHQQVAPLTGKDAETAASSDILRHNCAHWSGMLPRVP